MSINETKPLALSEQSPDGNLLSTISPDEDAETLAALKNLEERRKKNRRKRTIKIIVACGIVAALILFFVVGSLMGNKTSEGDITLQTDVAIRKDLTASVQGTGTCKPGSYVAVTPEVSGIIQDVLVAEGQHAEAGDTLFTLRNTELEKSVTDAQKALDRAQRALSEAQSDAADAQNAYDDAINTYNDAVDEYNELLDEDPEAASLIDPGEFDHSVYTTAIKSTQSAVESAQDALDSAQTSYNYAVEEADKRTVKAPAAGSVLDLKAVSGAAVGGAKGGTTTTTSEVLAQIADLSSLSINVEVNEMDISSVQVGQKAYVTFAAVSGLELEGEVTSVASVATGSEASASGGSTGGVVTFKATVVIRQPDPRLKPGMSASVRIVTNEVTDALVIPSSAVIDDRTSAYVLVVTDANTQETEMREVVVGSRTTSEVAIESGLEEGDIVVIDSLAGGGSSSSSSTL